ncbi:MAG: pyrroline-5-carboxylate reductase [Rudaea sp.]
MNESRQVPTTSATHALNNTRVAFIGGGNMARSLIGGLIRNAILAENIVAAEPNAQLRDALSEDFGIVCHADNATALRKADVVVLAVKPQVMRNVCAGLSDGVQHAKPLVISIAAGIRVEQLDHWLGGNVAIVRCMPNTPALIGAGATGLFANAHCNAAQRESAQAILATAGSTAWIDKESLMDTVTAISGSAPAYFFALVEALEDAATAQGLPRTIARALASQTCLGAGRMLREDAASPAQLRERVTSPGGTTQAALESFSADGFEAIVKRAVAAATHRGQELSAQLGD